MREAAGLTQQRLGEIADLKPATICLFESGSLAPTLTTVGALAKALGVRPSALLDFDAPTIPKAFAVDASEPALVERFRALPSRDRELVRALVAALARPGRADG